MCTDSFCGIAYGNSMHVCIFLVVPMAYTRSSKGPGPKCRLKTHSGRKIQYQTEGEWQGDLGPRMVTFVPTCRSLSPLDPRLN